MVCLSRLSRLARKGPAWSRHSLWAPALFVLFLPMGCGDDEPLTTPVADPVREIWQGTYTSDDQGDHGVVTIDLVRTGNEVRGEAVIRSRVNPHDFFTTAFMKGTLSGGVLTLSLNTDIVPYGYSFTLAGTYEEVFSGSISHSLSGLTGTFEFEQLEHGELSVESLFTFSSTVTGMAFDGDLLWLATSLEDYLRINKEGEIQDVVAVFWQQQYHWTSSALTSDGTLLWGHLPGQMGTFQVSSILEFTKTGEISREFDLEHRTGGLTHDGTDLWSLPITSDALHRFDEAGTILETLPIEPGDLVDLEFDGTHFWAIGWWLKLLYKIDGDGNVVSVYDLPTEAGESPMPSAIVFDGEDLWFAYSDFLAWDLSSRVYRMQMP